MGRSQTGFPWTKDFSAEENLHRKGWHVGDGETALGIRHLWLKLELPSMASEPKEAAQLPGGDEIWESNREQFSQGNL